MSYCVNCGVELNKAAKKCPLCSTPVINPSESMEQYTVPPYPPIDALIVVRRLRTTAAWLVTAMLLVPLILCPICDYIITGSITWSYYAIVSVMYAWTIIVPPIVIKRNPFIWCIWIYFFSTAAFLYCINLWATPEYSWFKMISLPILIYVLISTFLIAFCARRSKSIIAVTAAILLLMGIFSVLLEYLIIGFDSRVTDFVWSIPVIISCIGAAVVLTIIARIVKIAKVKNGLKKRMHL